MYELNIYLFFCCWITAAIIKVCLKEPDCDCVPKVIFPEVPNIDKTKRDKLRISYEEYYQSIEKEFTQSKIFL